MTTMREFCCDDMFRFNNVNMDKLTETVRLFRLSFYASQSIPFPSFGAKYNINLLLTHYKFTFIP